MADASTLYPLVFQPELKDKVWGGRRLGDVLGKAMPPDVPIGESWEVHGGSIIANGAHAGRTLDQARADLGSSLMGNEPSIEIFPLLLKYIDASEYLSVQVHPGDAYAREHTGYPYGKTEAWYIVHADPGAQLVHGWKSPTSAAEVEAAVREERLEDLLEYVPVVAGDVVYVPAGTVHAIGGGIVLGEIQQNSDTTYRLYDWGRMGFDGKPRELHVEESLKTLHYPRTEGHTIQHAELRDGGLLRRYLVACRYFVLESLEGDGDQEIPPPFSSFQLVSPLSGPVRLVWDGGELELERGRTALLPADLGWCGVVAGGEYRMLRAYVPDLLLDVTVPLREAGVVEERIVALGGDREHNDLVPVLAQMAHTPKVEADDPYGKYAKEQTESR